MSQCTAFWQVRSALFGLQHLSNLSLSFQSCGKITDLSPVITSVPQGIERLSVDVSKCKGLARLNNWGVDLSQRDRLRSVAFDFNACSKLEGAAAFGAVLGAMRPKALESFTVDFQHCAKPALTSTSSAKMNFCKTFCVFADFFSTYVLFGMSSP